MTMYKWCLGISGVKLDNLDNKLCYKNNLSYDVHSKYTQSLLVKLKLMKGKALRKHSLHEKTAASVLLKLFISGNE